MTVHIINPAAGKGNLSFEAFRRLKNECADVCCTEGVGDCERIVAQRLKDDPTLHFTVYGGDGTLCEAVNGIMTAGACDTSSLTLIPTGTGNDFARVIPHGFDSRVDLISYDTGAGARYAVNMLNIGFDCAVVHCMEAYRKKWYVTGSGAYIFSLIETLAKKPTIKTTLSMTLADGTEKTIDTEFLLITVANGRYCGGGFESNPLSELNDGVIDVLTASNISRRRFVSLVGNYRNGTHIDRETGKPIEKFKDIIDYFRCSSLKLSSLELLCADGEISAADSLAVSLVPKTLRILGTDFANI